LRSMSIFAQAGSRTSTGIALVNPNTIAANVTLVLRNSNSGELARTSFTLPPMGHIARYLTELFTGVSLGEFDGKIDVTSTQALAALTLRQREQVFTSLPV